MSIMSKNVNYVNRFSADKLEIKAAKAAVVSSLKQVPMETATVDQAKNLVIRLHNLDALIDAYKDQEEQAYGEKLFSAADVAFIEKGLRKAACSSRYRAAKAKAEDAAKSHKNIKTLRLEAEAERKLIKAQVTAIVRGGNPFAVASAKHWLNWKKRHEAAEKVQTIDVDIRLAPLANIEDKSKRNSFSVLNFSPKEILSSYMPFIEKIMGYNPNAKDANGKRIASEVLAEKLKEARVAVNELEKYIAATASKPIVVNEEDANITRLGESLLSRIFDIEVEEKRPTRAWIVIEHAIQKTIDPQWKVLGQNKAEAAERLEKIHKALYRHIGMRGVKLIRQTDDGYYDETIYKGLVASASHQKEEKLVMANEKLIAIHEEALYLGLTKEEAMHRCSDGAKWWKMRANMARPIVKPLLTKSGEKVFLHDGISVPDMKRVYVHQKALIVGKETEDDLLYKEGHATSNQVIGDGEALFLEEMENAASQLTAFGFKGMGVNIDSCEEYALSKNGRHCRPENLPDGRSLRGKKFIFGEGCNKFDAIYANFDELATALDKLAVKYPGLNQVYVLRESDDFEGAEKARYLSRSLLQQFLNLGLADIKTLVKATIGKLNNFKDLGRAWASFAQLNKPEQERTPYAKLFYEFPVLMLADNVQLINKSKFDSMLIEAMADYLVTEGQYPYGVQDPVALYEIWILGMDPNSPTVGALKAGELSVNGVRDGKKVGAVRFPTNAMTAKTLINRSYSDIYKSCGNVAIFAIQDDILILVDGDVDGDEFFILLNSLVVKLIDEMRLVFNPPVILFKHGSKGEKKLINTEVEFIVSMYDSLYSAKRYDSVGRYANLSRSALYLARIALKEGKMEEMQKWITYANLASTGAIISIDQVKGNEVDEDLIVLLEGKVAKEVAEAMTYKHPYTQQFVKQISADKCLAANELVATDLISTLIKDCVGEYSCDFGGLFNNKTAMIDAMIDGTVNTTTVRKAKITEGVALDLRWNYFRGAETKSAAILNAIKTGKRVGQSDLLYFYWENACALSYRMAGKSTFEKKEEYYKMVHDSLIAQALSTEWKCENGPLAGHVYTDEEKVASVVKAAVIDALEPNKKIDENGKTMNGNGVEEKSKASYCKFILNVFAEEIRANVRKNGWNIIDFMEGARVFGGADLYVDTGYEETDFDEIVKSEIPEVTEEEAAEAVASLKEDIDLGSDDDMTDCCF